ncbi:hypothetical protein [Mycolicibacterium lacusdiani]|uniref:hypothetical protein n=1 Tax=Mycolicibacterium lacusdiani TaxID=2895283 RepID=UPI001F415BCC|nr:hypothetical protein [Mycolicibacterium lacusdiani]
MTHAAEDAHADRSSALFNNRYLVSVVRAITRIGGATAFTTRELAVETRLPDSLVRPVLQRLLAAELLYEDHRLPGMRGAKYFRTAPGTAWAELEALCHALADPATPR